MCGIAGIWNKAHPPSQELVDQVVDLLEHRGPDDRGTFIDGPLGFGMRRLSIIDLASGKQPISNEDDSLVIVFNGEIYNYQSLRDELLAAGHQFKTQSDTETILHCYEQYGDACVDKLQGMFAFAIWDKNKERLFIARDRWGIKPLFYYWDNSKLVFSSELKSIRACSDLSMSLSSLSQYFSFLYFPFEHTPYTEVNKLPPGHTLVLERGDISISSYYQLPAVNSNPKLSSLEDWLEAFIEKANQVLKLHLLSEVPLGAFLSGGVDSSLIVALVSKLVDSPVNTFSIGYEHGGQHFDERGYARQVAELYSCNHRELLVTPAQIQDRLPEILGRLDEPIGDASVIPNYLLSEFTQQYVTVALSGLGGDEICAGYERHLGALLAERYPPLRWALANPLSKALIERIPDSSKGAHLPERLKRFAKNASLPLAQRYFSFISKFSEAEKMKLFSKDALEHLDSSLSSQSFDSLWQSFSNSSALSKVLQADLNTYMIDDLLCVSDRTSMAHSIEMRVPFVDHTMVEFFHQVPDNLKLAGMEKKYLLKKAAERYLPKEIIYRRKAGFSVPLTVWFRNELKSYVGDTLLSKEFLSSGLFERKYIETLLNEHNSQIRNHDERIFSLLSFAVWNQTN